MCIMRVCLQTARVVFAEEGLAGLFAGVAPRCGKCLCLRCLAPVLASPCPVSVLVCVTVWTILRPD